MRVSANVQSGSTSDADTIAVGVFEDEQPSEQSPAQLSELIASGEARRSFKALALSHAEGRRWLLVGLGARKDFTPERARVAAATVRDRARELSTRKLCWEVPGDGETAVAAALVEGTILSDYRFELHKSASEEEADAAPKSLDELIVSSPAPLDEPVADAALVAQAVNRARDLQNRPFRYCVHGSCKDFEMA